MLNIKKRCQVMKFFFLLSGPPSGKEALGTCPECVPIQPRMFKLLQFRGCHDIAILTITVIFQIHIPSSFWHGWWR